MPTNVVVNGITYPVALYGETGWAQGSGNLSQLLIALASAVASSPAFIQTVSVTTTPQTGATGHTYLVNTSIAIQINLPSPVVNTWLMVKDVSGLAQTNNITLHRFGTELIDGVSADKALNINSELCLIVSDGTNWYVLLEI